MTKSKIKGKIKKLRSLLTAAEGPDPQDALEPERIEEIISEIELLEYHLESCE